MPKGAAERRTVASADLKRAGARRVGTVVTTPPAKRAGATTDFVCSDRPHRSAVYEVRTAPRRADDRATRSAAAAGVASRRGDTKDHGTPRIAPIAKPRHAERAQDSKGEEDISTLTHQTSGTVAC